jgi:hypothetical protein
MTQRASGAAVTSGRAGKAAAVLLAVAIIGLPLLLARVLTR